jgi:hypothetical protein
LSRDNAAGRLLYSLKVSFPFHVQSLKLLEQTVELTVRCGHLYSYPGLCCCLGHPVWLYVFLRAQHACITGLQQLHVTQITSSKLHSSQPTVVTPQLQEASIP